MSSAPGVVCFARSWSQRVDPNSPRTRDLLPGGNASAFGRRRRESQRVEGNQLRDTWCAWTGVCHPARRVVTCSWFAQKPLSLSGVPGWRGPVVVCRAPGFTIHPSILAFQTHTCEVLLAAGQASSPRAVFVSESCGEESSTRSPASTASWSCCLQETDTRALQFASVRLCMWTAKLCLSLGTPRVRTPPAFSGHWVCPDLDFTVSLHHLKKVAEEQSHTKSKKADSWASSCCWPAMPAHEDANLTLHRSPNVPNTSASGRK